MRDVALVEHADRMPIEHVAVRVGDASRSGFLDAHRRHFGHPPAPSPRYPAPARPTRADQVER